MRPGLRVRACHRRRPGDAAAGPRGEGRRGLGSPAHTAAEPESADAGGGLRRLAGHPTLRLVAASACISTFATAFTMTAEVPLVLALGGGALGLGALAACWGAGMVVGSWYGGRALHAGNEATGVLVGRVAMAAGVGLVAAAPGIAPALVATRWAASAAASWASRPSR